MTKKKIIWLVILGAIPIIIAFVFFITYFFQPVFLRRTYLDRIAELRIPRTAVIIEYRFGISSSGAEPFFAKLQLSQEEHYVLRSSFCFDDCYIFLFNRIRRTFDYVSINVDDILEIGARDNMTRRTSFFLAGSTRSVEALLVTTNEGEHFLYIFY